MLCSSVAVTLAVLVGRISTEGGNDTELAEFIKEAKEKNFPLEYNWIDCALRGYGSFVLWMHLVVYLILKYIHREVDDDAKGIVLLEEQPDTAKKTIAASAKASASTRTARESSKKSSKSVSKSRKRKRSLKGSKKGKKHTFEATTTEEEIEEDDTQEQFTLENVVTQVSQREYSESLIRERTELMKEFLEGFKKRSASKEETTKIQPAWVTAFYVGKENDPEYKTRVLMRDWLWRRGGAGTHSKEESSRMPTKSMMTLAKEPTREPPAPLAESLPSRAPKGHQVETLSGMEQFFDKYKTVGSVEKPSAEPHSMELVAMEAPTQRELVVLKESPTQSERKSVRDMIRREVSDSQTSSSIRLSLLQQEPFVATASSEAPISSKDSSGTEPSGKSVPVIVSKRSPTKGLS